MNKLPEKPALFITTMVLIGVLLASILSLVIVSALCNEPPGDVYISREPNTHTSIIPCFTQRLAAAGIGFFIPLILCFVMLYRAWRKRHRQG
jgi:hypothetical protein